MKNQTWLTVVGVALLAAVATTARGGSDSKLPADDFDRLDGKGASGKKVNVIEWEGNLEIHVYPAGSLKGLSLKLDQRDKAKPVMVIGYRFDLPAEPLIRRAILGIDLKDGFRAYRDPSSAAQGYDKVVITNHKLSKPLAELKLDPEPKQLYPDGHPMNAAGAAGLKGGARRPASEEPEYSPQNEDGTISPFRW